MFLHPLFNQKNNRKEDEVNQHMVLNFLRPSFEHTRDEQMSSNQWRTKNDGGV